MPIRSLVRRRFQVLIAGLALALLAVSHAAADHVEPVASDGPYVDAGCAHSCTILDTGDLKCWGRGGHGEAGRGSFSTVGDQPEGMGNGLRLVP